VSTLAAHASLGLPILFLWLPGGLAHCCLASRTFAFHGIVRRASWRVRTHQIQHSVLRSRCLTTFQAARLLSSPHPQLSHTPSRGEQPISPYQRDGSAGTETPDPTQIKYHSHQPAPQIPEAEPAPSFPSKSGKRLRCLENRNQPNNSRRRQRG
jgi:hypothetical protein